MVNAVLGSIHLISGEWLYKYIILQEDGSGIIHYCGRRIYLEYVGDVFPYWVER